MNNLEHMALYWDQVFVALIKTDGDLEAAERLMHEVSDETLFLPIEEPRAALAKLKGEAK